jgi:cation transport regulator ChaC
MSLLGRKADRKEPGEEEDYVWGVAYRIDPDKEDEVRAYLGESWNVERLIDVIEHREKVGTVQWMADWL